MGMADQMDRSRLSLAARYDKELATHTAEEKSFGDVTKLTISEWDGRSRQVTLKKFKEKNEAGEDTVVWKLLDPWFANKGWQPLKNTTTEAVEEITNGEVVDPNAATNQSISTDRSDRTVTTGREPTSAIVEMWSRDDNLTIRETLERMRRHLENGGELGSITVAELNELEGLYTQAQLNAVATVGSQSPIGPAPSAAQTEEKLSKLESGWLNIASIFTPIGVERALKFSKKIKPWGFLKRSAAGLVVAAVLLSLIHI